MMSTDSFPDDCTLRSWDTDSLDSQAQYASVGGSRLPHVSRLGNEHRRSVPFARFAWGRQFRELSLIEQPLRDKDLPPPRNQYAQRRCVRANTQSSRPASRVFQFFR
jgi:hypothetical protein